jgi:hypothetical protein
MVLVVQLERALLCGTVVPKWEVGLQIYLLAQETEEFSMVADVNEKANIPLAENIAAVVSSEVFLLLLEEKELPEWRIMEELRPGTR